MFVKGLKITAQMQQYNGLNRAGSSQHEVQFNLKMTQKAKSCHYALSLKSLRTVFFFNKLIL